MSLIPLVVLPIVILVFVGMLLYVHRRMELWTKYFVGLPAVCLVVILLIISFNESLETAFRQNAGRVGFILFFVWLTVILYLTRGRHL